MSAGEHNRGLRGPLSWALWICIGLLVGAALTRIVGPDDYASSTAPAVQEREAHNDDSAHEQSQAPEPLGIAIDPDHDPAPLPDRRDTGLEPRQDQDPSDDDHPAQDAHTDDASHDPAGPIPDIPLWLMLPFAALLGSIALMPFINAHFWHQRFPEVAFFLGSIVVAYYLLGFNQGAFKHGQTYGQYQMLHALKEFYSFIALVGGLFIVSGGVLIDVKGKGSPLANTLLLAFGAVLANIVGTTGASMLLLHPFMRMNKGRLRPIHIVYFIFIVSNCGGCLTPIGDPPLYLGYLKGIDFFWTLEHLWVNWAVVIAALLAMFYITDLRIGPGEQDQSRTGARGISISGIAGIVCLGLMILGVFIDPMLADRGVTALAGYPVGATFQVAVAVVAYKLAPKRIHDANEFNFFPVKEVGLLFCGIFATMAPALGYLAVHGHALGLGSATSYYFGTGALSGVLDNAPTYLNFLQISFGENEINPQSVATFLSDPQGVATLAAISTGAVFFGAMTYIGNGPNFMVKAIAESSGVDMPSFFGYLARAIVILLPVLVLHWLLFFVIL